MRTVVEAVASHVRARPEAVAVRSVTPEAVRLELTYDRLWREASAVAVALCAKLKAAATRSRGPGELALASGHKGSGSEDLDLAQQKVVAVGGVEDADLVVAQLAVLLAGAVYCPVDLDDPRCAHILSEANARVLVHASRPRDPESLQNAGIESLALGTLASGHVPADDKVSESPCETSPGPESISHIFFTSGSTGKPKGVVVSHASLLAYALSRARRSGMRGDADAVVFVASSLTFDPSLGEVFAALCNGAIVGITRAANVMGGHLTACMRVASTTHVCMTPTVVRMRGSDHVLPDDVPTLRELSLGGEPLPEALAREARSVWPSRCRLMNIYGVTEATVYQCITDVTAIDAPGSEKLVTETLEGISLGFVDPDAAAGAASTVEWILPSHLETACSHRSKRPCPEPPCEHEAARPAEIQELVVGGEQIARGYLHRRELTAARFFTDDRTGMRCFRTGDLSRIEWVPRDALARCERPVPLCTCGSFAGPFVRLLGRRDHQIKLRGVRIETGEIEFHLERLREKSLLLKDFAVVKEAAADSLVVWAVVAPTSECFGQVQWHEDDVGALPRCAEEAIRAFLRRFVPAVMVPTRVAAVRSFEAFSSPNGKRDVQRLCQLSVPPFGVLAARRGVSAHEADGASKSNGEVESASQHDAAVLTPLEAKIAGIWSVRLGVPPAVIGPWDSFASVGGDSLEAQRVTHELVSLAGGREAQVKATEESFGEFTGAFSVAKLLAAPCLRAYASDLARSVEAGPLISKAGSGSFDMNAGSDTARATDAAQHALFVAVADGLTDVVRVLTDRHLGGLDPDAGITRARRGKSPLHVAAAAGEAAVVGALLDAGANIFATTTDNVQAAHIAASAPGLGGTAALRLLLSALRERGVKRPSIVRDGRKQTLVHAAARGGNESSLALVLETLGQDFDKSDGAASVRILRCLDRWSRSALHWAVVNEHAGCVRLLLEAGAEAEPQLRENVKGRRTHLQYESPLEIAKRKENDSIVALLSSFCSHHSQ